MLENHSHPAIRNRNVPEKQSPPSIVPVPVEEPVEVPVEVPVIINPVVPTPVPAPVPPKTNYTPEPKPESKPKPKPKRVSKPKFKPSTEVVESITCILVNFKTHNLTKQALTSLLEFYSPVHVILVDNGSHDNSARMVKRASTMYPEVESILHEKNIGHGPAMHDAIQRSKTQYVFTLDSDCIVREGGFLERMLQRFKKHPSLYAIGWLRYVNPYTGVAASAKRTDYTGLIEYIHPHAALYDREKYLSLPPFSHFGAPCILNMREANKRNLRLESFPIDRYVTHLVAGTRRMYDGRWNPRMNESPGSWNEDRDWPI